MAGDALVAVCLAGSLFFKVDPSEGRNKVLLGLLITMAPFALVGPLIGPFMDRVRGGNRAVIIATAGLRVVVGGVMVFALADDSLLLFPEAFLMLVLGKTYQVAKAAVVPSIVSSDAALVEANSKLQVLGGLAGFAAAAPGGLLLLAGPQYAAALCALVFAAATVSALRLPTTQVAVASPAPDEIAELRSTRVVLVATSMAVIRGIVGFVTMLIAFELRGGAQISAAETLARNVSRNLGDIMLRLEVLPLDQPPKWYFAVVVPLGVLGGLAGASIAPRLRRLVPEERILAGALALLAVIGILAAVVGGLLAYMLLGFFVAFAAAAAKQAFDAVVQRDAPDANRGRSFARFEARFQVAWVIGAVVPVAISLPVTAGAVVVAVVSIGAGIVYALGGLPPMPKPSIGRRGGGAAWSSKLGFARPARADRSARSASSAQPVRLDEEPTAEMVDPDSTH